MDSRLSTTNAEEPLRGCAEAGMAGRCLDAGHIPIIGGDLNLHIGRLPDALSGVHARRPETQTRATATRDKGEVYPPNARGRVWMRRLRAFPGGGGYFVFSSFQGSLFECAKMGLFGAFPLPTIDSSN